jgi:hypothetical protein
LPSLVRLSLPCSSVFTEIFIPPFVSSAAKTYLESLRLEMEKLVLGTKALETWTPGADLESDDAIADGIQSRRQSPKSASTSEGRGPRPNKRMENRVL